MQRTFRRVNAVGEVLVFGQGRVIQINRVYGYDSELN